MIYLIFSFAFTPFGSARPGLAFSHSTRSFTHAVVSLGPTICECLCASAFFFLHSLYLVCCAQRGIISLVRSLNVVAAQIVAWLDRFAVVFFSQSDASKLLFFLFSFSRSARNIPSEFCELLFHFFCLCLWHRNYQLHHFGSFTSPPPPHQTYTTCTFYRHHAIFFECNTVEWWR